MRLLRLRGRVLFPLVMAVAVLTGAGSGLLGVCGPFTDVTDATFCPFVLEIFTLGITTGTTPTTYDPTSSVSRLQMAAFLSRTVDGVLKRGSGRAVLDRFWTTQGGTSVAITTVGTNPVGVKSDGADVWVADSGDGQVFRIRASDGRILDTWTGATQSRGVICGAGRVLITGATTPAALYLIDPSGPPGAVSVVSTSLAAPVRGIAFDGARLWISGDSAVSIVTPGLSIPWTVTTVTAGFNQMSGPVFDGSNIWFSNQTTGTLVKVDPAGVILQTVTVGAFPSFPMYDGSNLWVPNRNSNSVTIVRASTGAVLTTLTGNGLDMPNAAAFEGQRVLVTNLNANNVSLFKAADLSPIGFFDIGGTNNRVASDGLHFWVTLLANNAVARF